MPTPFIVHQEIAAYCNETWRCFLKSSMFPAPQLRHAWCSCARNIDGFRFCISNLRVFRDRNRLCVGVHALMTPWELVLGSVMAVGLTVYLVYAMLRPENF